ncbi:membrane associated protein, putative, partial [Trypanosoma cruzi]
LPPPFEIFPIDDQLEKKEEDAIKAEIERRLQAKQQERINNEQTTHYSSSQNISLAFGIEPSSTVKYGESTQEENGKRSQSEAEERARREAEERARREAEERAQREAEERAQREAEERARREAEKRARREAKERAWQEAEERAQREAEERARREAEERARREVEERARQEAEELARQESEERARQEAEERAWQEAEERAQREAEERAQREAEQRAQREAEKRAQREAEKRAQREAEERAQREAEERAQREAERRARREAEERARQEAEERAWQEAEERAQREAEERAQREAERRARREAEKRAQREAERRAQREAEERAQREAEERAQREAEKRAQREAEERAKREAEERAQREAEKRAQREVEERAQREAEERAQREAEERAQREAERRAQREAEERAQREAEERAQREAEERAQREAEKRAQREAEERAQREAEERAQREAERRAQREAEERAQREAEERAQREAEDRAQREAEERAQREAEERAQREAERRAQREAEERAQREAEERAQREAEERAQREAEKRAQREAEKRAQREAEERAQREAEKRAQREAEDRAQREAERRAQREAERRAQREAERRAQREAEKRAQREAEERARREAEKRAQREAEERAQREAEERAQREAEERAQREAEERALNSNDVVLTMGGVTEGRSKLVAPAERSLVPSGEAEEEVGGDSDDEYETISNGSCTNNSVVSQVENDNGILSGMTGSATDVLSAANPPYELFEEYASQELKRLGLTEAELRCRRIECHRYETIREPGRCLFPPGERPEGDLSAASVQLGFFCAKQVIVSSSIPRQTKVAKRERHGDPNRRPLSRVHCFFESELVQDPSVTFDDEDLPHNASSECVITERELLTGPTNTAVNRALARVSFGDPIQVWERTRGRSFNLLESGDKKLQRQRTHTTGPTANDIWVSEIDAGKPTTAVKVFAGGVPLRVECTKIGGPMIDIHGSDVDPVILSLAFFSITSNSRLKVSETFFFHSAVDIFYPHKERQELSRRNQVVAFIPREFMSSLHLVVHAFRPASEDYDNYVDLYTRPDRYKNQHVIQMKQETQLLAITSDVLEELGWGFVHCQQDSNSRSVTLSIQKLYRKSVCDTQLCKLLDDEKSRNTFRTVPFELEFTISECTSHEVAFPSQHDKPLPEENETMVSLLDLDIPGARAETYRYVPCAIPILNSGFFNAYHNVYYFRLKKVKIINVGVLRKVPNTHRTYLMQICVKDQDVSLGEEGLPLIYGRGLSGKRLETSAWSSTIHNCLEFELNDEFKLQLPLFLTDAHHIFITLYASYQKKNPPTPGQQRLYKIGYAAFPICRNGVVRVKQDWSINFVSAEQAVVIAAGGYLKKFPEAPSSALLNNGIPVLNASTQTRTSVHASNELIAGVLRGATPALKSISQNDNVLAVSGKLSAGVAARDDGAHAKIIALMRKLPLAEILAFFPFLSFFSLALVSSPSSHVSLDCRTAALDVLVDMTFRAQEYDVSTQASRRRQGQPTAPGYIRTSVTTVLYHHLSNNVLYSGQRYRLYAGVAEAWLNLLTQTRHASSGPAVKPTSDGASDTENKSKGNTPLQRNVKKQMADLSWYLFDVILRSIYLMALENPNTSRSELFHPSFYTLIRKLCTEVLDVLGGFTVGGILVRRVALFLRNLGNYCDRGHLLEIYQSVVKFFEERGEMEGLCAFLKITMEDPDVVGWMLPLSGHEKPIFFTRIFVDAMSRLLVHRDRDTRAEAAEMLYAFLCGLANNPRIPAVNLRWLASQLFSLLRPLSLQWKTYMQLCEKVEGTVAAVDQRQLVVSILWITYYTSREVLRQWLLTEEDSKVFAGFMSLMTDAQSLFRYSAGTDKSEFRGGKNTAKELREWDARMSTFSTAMGSRMCSIFLEYIPHILRTLRNDRANVVVYPFFITLENLVHLGNSTLALQIGSSALFEVVCSLFPEIISRTARMSSGIVLLTFRLMSSCSQHVRSIAGRTFFFMSQSYFKWNRSLARMKSLTANALVSVAESKTRDLRLAGRFIEFQFDDLFEKARREEEYFRAPSQDYDTRYESDSNQSCGNSGVTYRYDVDPLFLSVQRRLSVSQYLLEREKKEQGKNKHAGE